MKALGVAGLCVLTLARADAQCLDTPLLASDGGAQHEFGAAVSVSGDLALIGAPGWPGVGGAGAAYVYERQGGQWTELARLVPGDTSTNQRFGVAVAVIEGRAVVGASHDSQFGVEAGAVYVFDRVGASWIEAAKLHASDAVAEAIFGSSVALEPATPFRPERLVVGAPEDDGVALRAGAVYVFERIGDDWVETQKITASDTTFLDEFGFSVDVCASRILVGAPRGGQNNVGAAYVFDHTGLAWTETERLIVSNQFRVHSIGWAVSLSGDTAAIGAPGWSIFGAVYIFDEVGGSWAETARVADFDFRGLGRTVALSGDLLVTGADSFELPARPGSAVLFVRRPTGWIEFARFTSLTPVNDDYFSTAVALDGERAVFGSFGDDTAGFDGGLAHVTGSVFACIEPGDIGTAYCTPGNFNSAGLRGAIHAEGHEVADFNRFALVADQLPPERFGYFLTSTEQAAVPGAGGSQGVLCVGGAVGRFVDEVQTSGPDGTFAIVVDLEALPTTPPHAVLAGETWNFQAWYRDQNPGPTSNFTDGVTIAFE
ncbi:MAG: hypothetical protein GY711_13440 [bacterium]|nr:hypothetical protein [bacterium]